MAKILVHALAATAGGGITYLRQLLSYLADKGQEHQWIALLPTGSAIECPDVPHLSRIVPTSARTPVGRLWFDQRSLRQIIARERIDLLLATANFGMIRPPVPQVLLNRNALYFSSEHLAELRTRKEYRTLMATLARRQMAIASIRSSSVNVVPTEAFGRQILESIGRPLSRPMEVVPFGFDRNAYQRSLSEESRQRMLSRLSPVEGVRRVLLVSHYNYFRNFETLIRAMAILRKQHRHTGPVELILTTRLEQGLRQHRYDTSFAARLVDELGLADIVTMLGTVASHDLANLYPLADVVVCPSYAESFGHPMVEAMACARPIVAADRAVHREICGPAALYFSTFDPEQLAYRIGQILDDHQLAHSLAKQGAQRASEFQWDDHFERIRHLMISTLPTSARTQHHA
ncbi:glycosyltransferase family 4 protein [bacterium]|nr:glycosyltransferase family 4 protein [bacterium]